MGLFSLPEPCRDLGQVQPCSSAPHEVPVCRRVPLQAREHRIPLCQWKSSAAGEPLCPFPVSWVASMRQQRVLGGCAGGRIQPRGWCPAGPARALGTSAATSPGQPGRPCHQPRKPQLWPQPGGSRGRETKPSTEQSKGALREPRPLQSCPGPCLWASEGSAPAVSVLINPHIKAGAAKHPWEAAGIPQQCGR